MMRLLLLATLLVHLPSEVRAQRPMHDDRFHWGPVEVVVFADTISGVGVMAGTTETYDASQFRGFGASFDPAVVEAWAGEATAFVEARALEGTEAVRAAPALVNAGSDSLLLFRRRRDDRWEPAVIVQLVSGRAGAGMTLLTTRDQARDLLRSLRRHAPTSRYQPALLQTSADLAAAGASYDVAPRVLFKGANHHFGRRGDAVLRFTVTVEGRVDPGSFETVQADDEMFAAAARASLVTSRWEPALALGVRMESRVILTIHFE